MANEEKRPSPQPQQPQLPPQQSSQLQMPPWWPFPYVQQQPPQGPEGGARKYERQSNGGGGFEIGYGSAVLKLFGPNVACIVVNLALAGMILFFYHEVTAWHARLDAQVAVILAQLKVNQNETEKNRTLILAIDENAKQQRNLLQEWVYRLLQRQGDWLREDNRSIGK